MLGDMAEVKGRILLLRSDQHPHTYYNKSGQSQFFLFNANTTIIQGESFLSQQLRH